MQDTKTVKIYLDDIREAPSDFIRTCSVNETKRLIETLEKEGTAIELLDFDHDLGDYSEDGGDAIRLLDWLVERNALYPIRIHTMNVVGRGNMQRIISRYWNQ